MAAVTTIAAGGWSTGSTVFSGGSGVGGVPTNADTVTITHAITLDTTAAVADSVVINASGSLIASTAGDSKLVVDKTITTAANSTAVVTLDMSSVPQYKCEILTNADTGSNNNLITLSGDFDLIGAPKTAWTYVAGALTAGATSAAVDDATGWRIGDILVFCTTQAYNATPRVDVVTLNGSYTNGSTSLSWTGGLTYDHADNCIVGNFTRNLIIGPASRSNADTSGLRIGSVGRATAAIIRDVMFDRCRQASSGSLVFGLDISGGMQTTAEISNNAFYEWQGTAALYTGSVMGSATGVITRQNNIFYSTVSGAAALSFSNISGRTMGDEISPVIFRAAVGISDYPIGSKIIDPKVSGCTTSGFFPRGLVEDIAEGVGTYGGAGVWSCRDAVNLAQSTSSLLRFTDIRLGLGPHATNANYSAANNSVLLNPGSGNYSVEFYNCDENISGGSIWSSLFGLQDAQFRLFNRDKDTDVQEVYSYTSTTVPTRNKSVVAAEVTRSASSLVMTWTGTNADAWDATVAVPVRGGVDSRILIYLAKSAANSPVSGDVAYGASTLPYAELSGLGITPVRVTLDTDSVAGYDSGIFELAAIDLTSANAPADGGILTLTLVGQSSTTAAQCYFAGIPISPFITGEVRHFGYVFNGQITRDRDSTVTISAVDTDLPTPTELVASETTAAAIGGMTITWGATSSITLTANRSFQQLVDYVAAKACVNVANALPVTWAGVVGSPSIFAAGDIDVTGFELRGSGSLAMGAHTLTSDDVFSYTYTGGTFSQAASVPTFAGGTLNIGAAGTYTFTQAASMTVSATPTSASNYVLSNGTFTGTLTFHNTTAYNITVEVPTGTTTSSTGSPGAGTVTFVSPQIYQTVTITGFTAGSRIHIYDTTNSVELFNGTATAGNTVVSGTTATWTDPTPAAGTRAIRVRVAYVSGVTAKQFQELTGLSCGVTSGTESITYPVTPENDTTYNANGENGSTIYGGGEITFVDSSPDRVEMAISTNTLSLPKMYAAWVYFAFTEAGIAVDIDYIRAIDTANYEYSNIRWKNTSSPTAPLKITGGYAWDSTTLDPMTLIDTDGGTIFLAPAHVVAYQTSGTYAITGDITTVLAAIPSATANATAVLSAAQSTPIYADARKMNGATITGTGVDSDLWRGA